MPGTVARFQRSGPYADGWRLVSPD